MAKSERTGEHSSKAWKDDLWPEQRASAWKTCRGFSHPEHLGDTLAFVGAILAILPRRPLSTCSASGP
jgi:hypothetical protein